MRSAVTGSGRGVRTRPGGPLLPLLFVLAAALPQPSAALQIAPGSLAVQQSYNGVLWTPLIPGDTVTVNNYIRITMTLVNNSGLLGNLCADIGSPPGVNVAKPNESSCIFANPTDWITENNGVMAMGSWGLGSGQLWIWPVIGGCPTGLYPDIIGSPVSLLAAQPVTTFSYNGTFLDVVEAYDPASETWTTMTPMPAGRARFGVAAVGGKFYVIGGRGRTGLSTTTYVYDAAANSWTTAAPIPTPREGLAVAAANGKIYAIGGRDATGVVLNTIEEYNPGTNTWTTGLPGMATARFSPAAAGLGPPGSELVYVMGGFDGSFFGASYGDTEVYDPASVSWPGTSTATFTPRGDLGAASDGTYVWAVGGWDWNIVRGETDAYSPDTWLPAVLLNKPRTRLAVAAIGGSVYAVGGVATGNVSTDYGLMDMSPSSSGGLTDLSGNNEEYRPLDGTWTSKPDMPTPRTWLGAAASNAAGTDLVYAIGGFTGLEFTNVADPDTATITWTFVARSEWPSLDFSVFAANAEDRGDGYDTSSWEGSYYDSVSCGSFLGDNTLQQIFTDQWFGTLVIASQFKCKSRVEILSGGTRPPGVAYVGDMVRIVTSITNTGAAVTLNSIDACCAWHPNAPSDPPNGAPSPPKGNVCVVPTTGPGACSPNNSQPGSPSLPDTIPDLASYPANVKDYTWDFGVSGNAFFPGFGGCTTGGVGSGTAYWDVLIQGAKSETPYIYVQPAPLRVTATTWVDPDGPGGPEVPVPMGYDNGSGAALTYYYMGVESIEARFIYTNTSTVFSFDVQPDVAVGGFDSKAFIMLGGATPSGPLLLAPGQSATVGWAFTRTPGGSLDTCVSVPQVSTFTSAARGAAATQSVMISDVPFRPMGPSPGGLPVGSRNLTLEASTNAPAGSPFTINLYARNAESRTFVLDPAVEIYLTRSSFGGDVSWTSSPTAPPITWTAGQNRTLSWVYLAETPGEMRWQGGLDFKSSSPPCLIACREGSVPLQYCNSTDGLYPWQRMFITIPGALSIQSFTASPPLSCKFGGQVVLVQMTVRNTSTIYCAELATICDDNTPQTDPIAFAQQYGASQAACFPIQPIPFPMTAIAISPTATLNLTWCMEATQCSPSTIFGCFSSTHSFIEGRTHDCITKGVINPADGADWGGVAPSIAVTYPASLSCSTWANNSDYSVGQTITVFFTVVNEGGDNLSSFGVGIWPTTYLGAVVSLVAGPVPVVPPAYPGSGNCGPAAPYTSNQTFMWQFQTLSKGRVFFTVTAMGWDAECGTWKTTTCQTPVLRIASSAQLACSPPAVTPVVTMSVSCTGCAPASNCNRVTGAGCVNVSMDLSNFGDIPVQNVNVSLSDAPPAMLACFMPPNAGCASGSAVLESRTMPPQSLGTLASGTAVWRYSPSGLGCMQVKVEATGVDQATGVTLYCDGWSGCTQIRARRPMGLSLVGVPPQVAPGQQFTVQVSVCNPGDTPASLQNGEPAFSFSASGANVTDQYDVLPPAPVVLQPGECRTIDVVVTAHRNAQPGAVTIVVAQGGQYVAIDAATGLPFPAVDTGGALSTRVISLQNKLVVEINPVHILRSAVILMYQVADAGDRGGRTTLRLYTITGELVRTLVDKEAVIEEASVSWNGRNDEGQLCASGVYLARLESPTFSKVVKAAILK